MPYSQGPVHARLEHGQKPLRLHRASVAPVLVTALLAQVNDGAKYSPLDQVNAANVAQLRPAWTFHTGDLYLGYKGGFRGRASAFETTPLYADGRLFITTAFCRVIALDPVT